MLPTGEEGEVIFPVKDGNQSKDARGRRRILPGFHMFLRLEDI